MAPEIADSDAESDIVDNGPAVEQNEEYPDATNRNSTAQYIDSPPQIDFDHFIDPTQTLSEQSPQQHGAPGTGSTEKMLRGLADAQKNLAASSIGQQTGDTSNLTDSKGKRRHSAGEEHLSLGDVSGKKKRVKTYWSKPRSGSTIDLYADDHTATPPQTTPFISADLTDSGRLSQPGATEQEEQVQIDQIPIARERERPRRVISLLGQHGNSSGHQLSTTTSSYGGYQSIELDFRGGSNGLNIDANPFEGLSQVSAREEDLQPDVQTEMMTSPERPQDGRVPDFINPMLLVQNDATETTPIADDHLSKRRKTDNLARGTTTSPAPSSRRATSVSAESVSNMSDRSQPKKRGRKPKASKLADSPQPEIMAPPEMPEVPPSKRPRRGTLDSSQLSHDETPSNTKRKRKKSKTEPKPVDDTPTKHSSNELHLDDEKLIGLPKENYKPRPSRRRSRQTVDDDELQQALTASLAQVIEDVEPDAEQSSPAKHPSSDLHLDDELVIGLPKESYKPRPSRRRSRAIDEEDLAKTEFLLPDIREDEVHNEDTPNEPTAAPSQFAPKTKKAKKSKIKRAKTSAAALLKKSSQMLSDGEDDVLWLDSKPTPVKLDLPPEIKVLKTEEKVNCETTTPKRESKISVEIPVTRLARTPTKPDEGETTNKKKRGRPKKSPIGLPPSGLPPGSPALDRAPTPEPLTDIEAAVTGEGEAEAEADAAEDEEEDDDDDIRPTTRTRIRAPLASMNPNVQPLPPAPILPAKTSDLGKESLAPTSPSKPPPPTSPASTTTTTTTTTTPPPPIHSPIRPSPAWNSRSKYRVGLSKRQSIPSLLRKVDKTKAAPSKVGVKKLKERKLRKGENADADTDEEADGGGGGGNGELRDKDGNLVEWEF